MNTKEFKKRLLQCDKTTSGKHLMTEYVDSEEWARFEDGQVRLQVRKCAACGMVDDLREDEQSI